MTILSSMLRPVFFLLGLLATAFAKDITIIANDANSSSATNCSILTLIDFTGLLAEKAYPSALSLSQAAYSQMAAALLAKRHFNDRNPEIVPELQQLGDCSVQIPEDTWWVDSRYDPTTPLQALMPLEEACAVVGPFLTRAVEAASGLSQLRHIPLLTWAQNERLSDASHYPSIARIGGETKWFAMAVAEYIQNFPRDFVAILADSQDYGEQFEDPLEDHGEDELGMETTSEFLSDEESVEAGLLEVLRKGFHTIVLVSDRSSFLQVVAQTAARLDMIGPEWFWLLSGETLTPEILDSLRLVPGSPLDRLLQGAAIFADYDPFLMRTNNNNDSDPFLQSWKRQGPDLVHTVNRYHPLLNNNNHNNMQVFQGTEAYFEDYDPSRRASLLYDSIVATGMAACQLEAKKRENQTTTSHLQEILSMDFQGASGQVRFQTEEDGTAKANSRDPNGMAFGMLNVRPYQDQDNYMRRYKSVLTAIYKEGEWQEVPNEQFIYYDGTANPPMPLVTTADYHFLQDGVLVVGRLIVALSLFLTIATGSWVFLQRKAPAVKMSQPEFLILMCFGSFLLSLSSVFHSFDENQGKSEEELTRLCSVTPWFFVGGYLIIYCAIFAKFWRLVKLMSLRRAKITVQRSLWPFCLFIPTSLVILTCWQVMDPLAWKREVINEEPFETAGYCRSEDATPFLISLGILILVVTCMTQFVAWKCRKFQEEIAEVKWVFYGTMSHLQTWIIFLPIMVALSDTSPTTTYLMFSILTFLFSTTMVTLVIWPKIYTVHFSAQFEGSRRHINVTNSPSCAVSGLDVSASHHRISAVSGLDDYSGRVRFRNSNAASAKGTERSIDERGSGVTSKTSSSEIKDPNIPSAMSRRGNTYTPLQPKTNPNTIPDLEGFPSSSSEVSRPEPNERTKGNTPPATPDPLLCKQGDAKDQTCHTEACADPDSTFFSNELLELEKRGAV